MSNETNTSKPFKPQDLLSFNVMITPFVILIIYWAGIAGAVYMGARQVVAGIRWDSFSEVLLGLGVLVLGPIYVRVLCELTILAFKILDELRAVRNALTSARNTSSNTPSQPPSA